MKGHDVPSGQEGQRSRLQRSPPPSHGLTHDIEAPGNENCFPRDDMAGAFETQSMPHSPMDELRPSLYHNDLSDDSELEEGEDTRLARSMNRRGSKESFALYSPDEERSVLHKLDRRLVLFVALLYMLSFLDRSNIGNAKIAGLSKDLSLSSSQYEWLLTAFYITYILFEWMTLLYRVVPPHIYISICVVSWGLIASLQAIADSFASMFILRALLGISEAAFGPGVPFYLSFFFKRDELAMRTGLFISAAPLATSFASSLAWCITKAGQHTPIAAWRLLFLIEGFPSMIVAVIAWYQIPDTPGTATFLSKREQKVATLRLRHEKTQGVHGKRRRLQWREIGRTLIDPKSYLMSLMFFSCNVAFSSLPPFLPTIINEMSFTPLASQALSAPPYLLSFLLVLLVARLSDHHRARAPYIVGASLCGSLGYLILALSGPLHLPTFVRYAAVFPSAAGFFVSITLIITWTLNNQASDEGKGTGVAMLNVIGQLGPLLGTRLYPDDDAPYYVRGMAVCAGFMAVVAVLAGVLRLVLVTANRRGEAERGYVPVREGAEDEEGMEMEDAGSGRKEKAERRFVYML